MDCMALNRDFIGRAFPSPEPYEITRVKIKEFADAIGDLNPIYRDQDAAKAAGHPDVLAPPTFPIVLALGGDSLDDPELGLDWAMVVHGEQRFEYRRPLHAGDVVTTESTIAGMRSIGRNERLEIQTVITTVEGEHVCTAHNVLIERGA
jgi:acyl dehydratase